MRRLGLLTCVSLGLLAFACTQDNPAFDDCETDASCVDESGSPGDGDSGDGDPGDGDSGDGDPGDGDAGDGDGDAGDGDGDPALPSCPESIWVSMSVVQDTFLDGSLDPAPGCVIDWDFEQDLPKFLNGGECSTLDFGASPGHWACDSDICTSMWLGKFALAEWMQESVQVQEAGFEFTAKYRNGEANSVIAYELEVDEVDFGECFEWHAGEGEGDPPSECATTFDHSAFPNFWSNDGQPIQGAMIATANLPASGDSYVEESFFMSIDPTLVQGWLDGQVVHHGVLVSSGAWLPTELYLYAQGSGAEPLLKARLCLP